MLTVRFFGGLRTRFGDGWTLDVHSPREALHALIVQLPGLRAYFQDNANRPFLVRGDTQDYDESDLHYPQSTGTLCVVPLVQGAGAFGKILAGIALVALAFVLPASLAGITTAMASMGAALALSGIAQLLSPRQKAEPTPEKPENEPSLAFDGAVNTMGQGGCVPLGYGRMRVGSAIISVGFSTNNELLL
ncbi:tail assembly protein [Paraburkholderia adhaesiva]|uniref:tail assembly protein n=1 Tax=Paraburkholderia adhaesiva TaxID=2883244 RepID=UPI001F3A0946|nr:tail assembly protein [Paraburkholderia adhaesiva]